MLNRKKRDGFYGFAFWQSIGCRSFSSAVTSVNRRYHGLRINIIACFKSQLQSTRFYIGHKSKLTIWDITACLNCNADKVSQKDCYIERECPGNGNQQEDSFIHFSSNLNQHTRDSHHRREVESLNYMRSSKQKEGTLFAIHSRVAVTRKKFTGA